MEILKALPGVLEIVLKQLELLGNWFITPIATIGNITIIPLLVIAPNVLIVILGIIIARFII